MNWKTLVGSAIAAAGTYILVKNGSSAKDKDITLDNVWIDRNEVTAMFTNGNNKSFVVTHDKGKWYTVKECELIDATVCIKLTKLVKQHLKEHGQTF